MKKKKRRVLMRLQWKRGMAVFLAALMLFQTPAMSTVNADSVSENQVVTEAVTEETGDNEATAAKETTADNEATAVEETTAVNEAAEVADVNDSEQEADTVSSNTVEETVSENTVEQTLLNWVYIENSYIASPGTQSILVSIGDENTGITEGTLTYENTATKETFEMKASIADGTAFDDSLLFIKDFTSADKGIYKLLEVSYKTAEEETVIDLTKTAGIQAFFGVDEEVITTEEQMEVSTEVVTIDENGQATEASSIEEAIETAKEDVVNTNSRSLYAGAGANSEFVVVLDPGHDNTHAGARANGLEEEDLTLKIAQYCKAKLETYSDIKVYMTRSSSVCPYPGTTSTVCNSNRVAAAKEVGANIYVSFHLNSSPSASASGAEVYYPNTSYNSDIGSKGSVLAEEIQKKLKALGLNDRGIKIRNSEDNSLYPDGSLADYYGVIKNSKLNGFPGIIIEHAFLTNSSDASLLSTEAGLRKLGEADAEGIASYYNLVGKDEVGEDTVEFKSGKLSIVNKDLIAGTFTAKVINVTPYDEVNKVVFKVWTKSDKSDLKSYKAKDLGNGTFTANVSAAKHNNVEGKYYVYAYAVDEDGKETLLKKTSVTMRPTFDNVSVKRTVSGNKLQYYKVETTGLEKAQSVGIKIWYKKSGSSTALSYKAKKTSAGTWYYNIPLKKMPKEGKYKIEVRAKAAYGSEKLVKTVSFTYKRNATVTAKKTSSTQKKFKIQLQGMSYASKVSFQVWSKTGGKDDLKTYKAKKNSKGNWYYNLAISKHKTAGKYYVVAVAKVGDETITLSKKSFTVTGPSAKSIKIENKQSDTFDVLVSGISSPAGFSKKVEIAVWCKADKSDLKTYKAKVRKDGTSRITVNIKNHKKNYGTYKVSVKLTDNNGIKTTLATKKVKMTKSTTASAGKYAIMGTTTTNVDQMVAYYNANADYPDFYADSDAKTITTFCKMYLSECKAEGVKAEVAFVQAMKETNFLKYGGDVQISQYNFAGLGATGGGVCGNSFSSVRIGIRAQVQHLKAYASTEALNKTCVDPRYAYVTKGCAPYVEWLGINENPTGKGWATDVGYGNDIVKRINDLKTY